MGLGVMGLGVMGFGVMGFGVMGFGVMAGRYALASAARARWSRPGSDRLGIISIQCRVSLLVARLDL